MKSDSHLINGSSDCGKGQQMNWGRHTEPVLQEHQAAVSNLGKQLMRAFVIFNGVVKSGAIV